MEFSAGKKIEPSWRNFIFLIRPRRVFSETGKTRFRKFSIFGTYEKPETKKLGLKKRGSEFFVSSEFGL